MADAQGVTVSESGRKSSLTTYRIGGPFPGYPSQEISRISKAFLGNRCTIYGDKGGSKGYAAKDVHDYIW